MPRHLIALGPMALATMLLAGCGPDAAQQLAQARTAFSAHRYAAARDALSGALAQNPDDPAARELKARVALALGDGEAALPLLLGLARRPADYPVLLGEAQLLRDNPDEALAAIGAAQSPAAQRIRALAFLAKGDRAKSEAALVAGLQQQPTDARLAADLARFRMQAGDLAGANAALVKGRQAEPHSLDVLLVGAELATARGDRAKALLAYDDAVRLYPENLAAIAGKAATLGDLGRNAEMEKTLALTGGSTGRNGSIAYVQARAAAARNDPASARRILEANAESLKDNPAATVLHAQVLRQLGQTEQAGAQLVPLLTNDPGNVVARRLLAQIQIEQRDGVRAMATLQPLVSIPAADPGDMRSYAAAARLAGTPDSARIDEQARFPRAQWLAATLAEADTGMKQANWARAADAYTRLLQVTRATNPLVLNNLAIAESALGKKREALGHAMAALKLAPNSPSVMDTVGQLIVETGGDRGQALSLLRKAAAAAPGNPAIRAHLADAERPAGTRG